MAGLLGGRLAARGTRWQQMGGTYWVNWKVVEILPSGGGGGGGGGSGGGGGGGFFSVQAPQIRRW